MDAFHGRGEWRRAAADTELVQGWAAVEPEVRSALLLAFAWSSRAATIAEPADSSMHGSGDPAPGALHIPPGADPADPQAPTTVVWPLPTSAGQHLR